MGTETAGKKPVAVRNVNLVAALATARTNRAGDDIGPGVDIVLRIADDSRLAGCPARCVYPYDLVHRYGEPAKRIILTQIIFHCKWELRQIFKLFQIAGRNVLAVALRFEWSDIFIGVGDRLLQAKQLQRLQFVETGLLNGIQYVRIRHAANHRSSGNETMILEVE